MVAITNEISQYGNPQRNHDTQPGSSQISQIPAAYTGDDQKSDQCDQRWVEHNAYPEDPLAIAFCQSNRVVARLAGTNRN